MRPGAAGLLALALVLLAPSVAAAVRILPPGPEDSFERAEIDLNATGRVAVAYEPRRPRATRSSSRSARRPS